MNLDTSTTKKTSVPKYVCKYPVKNLHIKIPKVKVAATPKVLGSTNPKF
jgi:hypothetical protein